MKAIFLLLIPALAVATKLQVLNPTLSQTGDAAVVRYEVDQRDLRPGMNYFIVAYLSTPHHPVAARLIPSAKGEMTFNLVNMRVPYLFKLMKTALLAVPLVDGHEKDLISFVNTAVTVAESGPVTFVNFNAPEKVHLALGMSGEMVIMWTSGSNDTPKVIYVDHLGQTQTVTGTPVTYTINEMCAAPANVPANFADPGFIHTVRLTALRAEYQYKYRYGSDHDGMSTEESFNLAATTFGRPTTVLAFGDMGVKPDQQPAEPVSAAMTNHVNAGGVDLALHIGDLSYARGYAWKWEAFMDEIQPMAKKVPYMVSVGNHEYDHVAQQWKPSWSDFGNDSGGECGIPYSKRFTMPTPALQADAGNLWYSFDVGNMHFTIMSGEHSYLEGTAQWNWLKNDLINVDRRRTPWLFFGSHRPFYQTMVSPWGDASRAQMQDAIEPLLIKYKVDLAIWGHTHYYERTCLVKDWACDPQGVPHLIIGMAGNSYQPPFKPEAQYTMFRSRDFGFTKLMSANSTHLHVQFYGQNGTAILDDFWITH